MAKKDFRRKFTLFFVPHSTFRTFKLSFSVNFLIFAFVLWTGVTIWAGYLSGRHVDYWRVKAENSLMRIKVALFAKQIRSSLSMLEQVREDEFSLRELLDMKSKKSIVEAGLAIGGPTPEDVTSLNLFIAGKVYDMSQQDIVHETKVLLNQTQNRIESCKEIFDFVDTERMIFKATPNMWPTFGVITSKYGYRQHPLYRRMDFHTGIDIANVKGTKILATAYGTVKVATWAPGYGRVIVIDHGYRYVTCYGHLSKFLVKKGDRVTRGQTIALMGASGTATGSHIHYEVHYRGSPTNPYKYMKQSTENIF